LEEEYPEAAPFIREAVREHGEDWVIENYFLKVAQLGVMMDIPAVEELPFYDEDRHDVPSRQEKRERAEAFREYRESLRTGKESGDE
jgi:hypothetical protein